MPCAAPVDSAAWVHTAALETDLHRAKSGRVLFSSYFASLSLSRPPFVSLSLSCSCLDLSVRFLSQRQQPTTSAVRMGSRVSVVEKRLDETKEHLLLVNRLSDKSGAHTAQIHKLSETVTELCKLLGVEERFRATVQATQVCM